MENIIQLLREAELSLFPMKGKGVGAFLLFGIALTAILTFGGFRIDLTELANAFRRS